MNVQQPNEKCCENGKIPCSCPKGGLVGEAERPCDKCGGYEWVDCPNHTPTEKWEEELHKFKKQVEEWNCDAECYIDIPALRNFISHLLSQARKEERVHLHSLGLLFGCPLFIETDDPKNVELANKHFDHLIRLWKKEGEPNSNEI